MSFLSDNDPIPNKFTVHMGELIKAAREEAGLSQAELAKQIFRRRATVSDIENGKSEVGSITLGRIAAILEKPITYFFPRYTKIADIDELSPYELELLHHFKSLYDDNIRISVVSMVKSLSNYSPVDSLKELKQRAADSADFDNELLKHLEK